MSAHFQYHAPESWDEVIALLHQHGGDAKLLAGGTDLMIQIEREQIAPKHVISLDHIPGWDSFTLNGTLIIGAGTTYRQLERESQLYGKHLALVEAARQVGSVQVRNVATVGGNFCNASPAADSVPPLIIMDAQLHLYGTSGKRTISADTFITAPGQTVLKQGELLRQITVPALPDRTATVFLKAGRRRAMELSIVCVAVRLTLATDNTCQTARIALGAVAPTPLRVTTAEAVLEGQAITPEAIQKAAQLTAAATSPIADVRASAEYRRYLTEALVQRGLELCLDRIAEGN